MMAKIICYGSPAQELYEVDFGKILFGGATNLIG
jgi:hypothetical protein